MMPALDTTEASTADLIQKVALSLLKAPPRFPEFFRKAWDVLEPQKALVYNWHIDCIAEHLEAVDLGQIQNLRISIPPRHLKSTLVTVAWPSWSWVERPWLRWVFSSYSGALAVKHSISRRQIIQSAWYQREFGDTVVLSADQNRQDEFENTLRGFMLSVGTGGSITGRGGDRVVADDPINPEQAESEAERETAVRYWSQTLSTRLDDKKTGARVIVAQRLHEQDVIGSILKEEGWTHLVLPAEIDRPLSITFPITKRVVELKPGDLICSTREDAEVLRKQKLIMGSRSYNAQYNQRPEAAEGKIIKKSWFRRYRTLPEPGLLLNRGWSWDTAMEEGQENDYSVGLLADVYKEGIYIRWMSRKRLQFPELEAEMKACWAGKYPGGDATSTGSRFCVIEDKVSGKSMSQQLKRTTSVPIIPFKVSSDKTVRLNMASPMVEAGRVFLPEHAPWVEDFIEEVCGFPGPPHDDVTDSFSQLVNYLSPRQQSAWAWVKS